MYCIRLGLLYSLSDIVYVSLYNHFVFMKSDILINDIINSYHLEQTTQFMNDTYIF